LKRTRTALCLLLESGCGAGPPKLPTADDLPTHASPGHDTSRDTAVHDSGAPVETDADADGHPADIDCNDHDPAVHPGAEEVCDNGVDDNCDGRACRLPSPALSTLAAPPGHSAGVSVSIGDVTGDGAADLLVGAPDALSDGSLQSGGVWVWSTAVPDGTTPFEAGALFVGGDPDAPTAGRLVEAVGDVTGDGVGDLVVSTGHLPGEFQGRLALLAGPVVEGTDLSEAVGSFSIPESHRLLLFAARGPVVDGTPTLLLASPSEDAGVVRLFSGEWTTGQALDTAEMAWTGSSSEAGLGLHTPGDLDGDGVDDVVIGEPGAASVAVLLGPHEGGLLADADQQLTATVAEDGFGTRVSGAGDVDGDGLPDVLAGGAVGSGDAGTAVLFCGGERTECARFSGPEDDAQLGHSLHDSPDTDGDGHAEVLMATHGTSTAWVWYGPVSGSRTVADADASAVASGLAGFDLAAGTTVDGPTLLLGAPTSGTDDPPAGGAYVLTFPGL